MLWNCVNFSLKSEIKVLYVSLYLECDIGRCCREASQQNVRSCCSWRFITTTCSSRSSQFKRGSPCQTPHKYLKASSSSSEQIHGEERNCRRSWKLMYVSEMRAAAGTVTLSCRPRVLYVFPEWRIASSCAVQMTSLARKKVKGAEGWQATR